jgi:SP family myo-inositol transporter-like MFS transporter 13
LDAIFDKVETMTLSVYFLTAISAIGGFLFGYDTVSSIIILSKASILTTCILIPPKGVISGALVLIDEEFDLTDFQSELVVSVTVLGALCASIVAGPLSDRYGRRPVVLASSAVFAGGAVLMAVATRVEVLYAGRFIVGVGVGAASMCMPMYISEIGD